MRIGRIEFVQDQQFTRRFAAMRIEPRHQIGHRLFLPLLFSILADTHDLQG